MNLCLAIETSSGGYAVALGDGEAVLFSSNDEQSSSRDMASIVSHGLESAGASYKDIKAIGVNIGPGGLSSTRAGVSFANGLAFSLQVPIHPFSYFDIAARQISKYSELPVVCAVPAASGNAYVALLSRGSKTARFGPFQPTLIETARGIAEFAAAGRLRERLPGLLPDSRILDSGIDAPDPRILLELTFLAQQRGGEAATQVVPLNELAEQFHA